MNSCIRTLKSGVSVMAVAVGAALLGPVPALAQTIIIPSGTVSPSVNLVLNQSLLVQQGGAIFSAVDGGVNVGGNGVSITNAGDITSTFQHAIDTDFVNRNITVFNSGTLNAADDGINSFGGVITLTNTGSIIAAGDGLNGTVQGLNNSGLIQGGNFGILSANVSGVNSGTIVGVTQGGLVSGFTILDFLNTGTISGVTLGVNANTIQNFRNFGTIEGAVGFNATNTLQNLTNAGTIIGSNFAIQENNGGGDTQLTLLAGSNIQGRINLGGGVNTLNVGNGLSISNTFVGGAPVIGTTNGAPFAVSGNQVAVVDPTTLSTQDEALADLTGGIFSTVQNRLGSLRGRGVAGVTSNPRPMLVGSRDGGYGPVANGREYWVQGFGSWRDQEGDGPALDTGQFVAGVVSGFDAFYSASTRAGFFAGGLLGAGGEHAGDAADRHRLRLRRLLPLDAARAHRVGLRADRRLFRVRPRARGGQQPRRDRPADRPGRL